jgi:aminopeptidase N
MMVNVMDFSIKHWELPVQTIFIYSRWRWGMEYAMSTLMLGNGTLEGIYGTATHELGHSWFQHVLASNESKHPWMDEGFTTYVSDLAENEFATKKWQTLRRKL